MLTGWAENDILNLPIWLRIKYAELLNELDNKRLKAMQGGLK